MMSTEDRYDLAEKQLKSFTRSKVRTKILLCLKDADMSAAELEKAMGVRNTTILHAIKDMIKSEIITRTESGYGLTNLGKMQSYLLSDLVDVVLVMSEHQDFWLSHDISGIPTNLLQRIGMLGQSEVMKSDLSSPLKTVEFFVSEVINAGEVYGVSPIVVPGYADMMVRLVKNGAKVNLILTDHVLKITSKEYAKEYDKDAIRELLRRENFNLYRISEDVKVAFTVTDSFLSLGLYRFDGNYDLGSDLICIGEDAIMWGRELFKHYIRKSELIDADSLF